MAELFYAPLGIFYSGGTSFGPSSALLEESYDHVHVGLAVNADLSGAGTVAPIGGSANGTDPATANAKSGISGFFGTLSSDAAGVWTGRIVKTFVAIALIIFGLGRAVQ